MRLNNFIPFFFNPLLNFIFRKFLLVSSFFDFKLLAAIYVFLAMAYSIGECSIYSNNDSQTSCLIRDTFRGSRVWGMSLLFFLLWLTIFYTTPIIQKISLNYLNWVLIILILYFATYDKTIFRVVVLRKNKFQEYIYVLKSGFIKVSLIPIFRDIPGNYLIPVTLITNYILNFFFCIPELYDLSQNNYSSPIKDTPLKTIFIGILFRGGYSFYLSSYFFLIPGWQKILPVLPPLETYIFPIMGIVMNVSLYDVESTLEKGNNVVYKGLKIVLLSVMFGVFYLILDTSFCGKPMYINLFTIDFFSIGLLTVFTANLIYLKSVRYIYDPVDWWIGLSYLFTGVFTKFLIIPFSLILNYNLVIPLVLLIELFLIGIFLLSRRVLSKMINIPIE